MKIAIDFDGTCVTHEYPAVGKDIGAVPVLKELVLSGHKLILYTMRSGRELQDAIDWFKENGIELYAVGKDPDQEKWTSSNKTYAELYIDDAALGCPKIYPSTLRGRPYVDWLAVREKLVKTGHIWYETKETIEV